ncbi:MAG: ABC transporter permease [Elusimicrobia bacterium]|nr:ABC transporter permease [Elusimicrobiota bacterium]
MTGYQWDLFWMLARTEFRLRDQGTWVGFLWTLLHPLFIFLILHLLFTRWMGSRVEHYAAFLLIGIVQWNFFATATTGGLTSLRRKAGLIAHYAFPRVNIVLSSVFAVLLSHLLEWAVLLAALLALGVRPAPAWLLLPGVVLVELALAAGLSCLLSVLAVHVRDLDHVWGIVLYGLFFMTPVFYAPDMVGAAGQRVIAANPLAAIIGATRALVMGGGAPAAPGLLPVSLGAGMLLVAGLLLYPRLTRGIAERL